MPEAASRICVRAIINGYVIEAIASRFIHGHIRAVICATRKCRVRVACRRTHAHTSKSDVAHLCRSLDSTFRNMQCGDIFAVHLCCTTQSLFGLRDCDQFVNCSLSRKAPGADSLLTPVFRWHLNTRKDRTRSSAPVM